MWAEYTVGWLILLPLETTQQQNPHLASAKEDTSFWLGLAPNRCLWQAQHSLSCLGLGALWEPRLGPGEMGGAAESLPPPALTGTSAPSLSSPQGPQLVFPKQRLLDSNYAGEVQVPVLLLTNHLTLGKSASLNFSNERARVIPLSQIKCVRKPSEP